ncbi:3-dehydroquinate synthase [bacterium]|nr:3-dehydroquinate synthase [bacterium]
MKTLDISSPLGKCRVQKVSWRDQVSLLAKEGVVFVTDSHIHSFLGESLPQERTVILEPGEKRKTLSTVEKIYQRFLDWGVDRSWRAVGIGGGVVGDITGFAASTYMRGIPFILIPTTLLSQVDACVGGKTGVNFRGYKNIIGTFSQPQRILLDFDFLHTLPPKEILCGMAEIIKHALIASPSLFRFLEKEWPRLLALEEDVLEKAVFESLRIKSSVVKGDPKEKNRRRMLNFGHTLAHALEKTTGASHGEAVIQGMMWAVRISERKGILSEKNSQRIQTFLEEIKQFPSEGLPSLSLSEAVRKDKKKEKENLHYVFLSQVGEARVQKISYAQLEEFIDGLCES